MYMFRKIASHILKHLQRQSHVFSMERGRITIIKKNFIIRNCEKVDFWGIIRVSFTQMNIPRYKMYSFVVDSRKKRIKTQYLLYTSLIFSYKLHVSSARDLNKQAWKLVIYIFFYYKLMNYLLIISCF